jgi:hypothetical protein
MMGGFYERVKNGKSPAEALRSAKLDMLKAPGAYRRPYYWAPFQLFTRSDPFSNRARASRSVVELFRSGETATRDLSQYGWRDGASFPGLAQ